MAPGHHVAHAGAGEMFMAAPCRRSAARRGPAPWSPAAGRSSDDRKDAAAGRWKVVRSGRAGCGRPSTALPSASITRPSSSLATRSQRVVRQADAVPVPHAGGLAQRVQQPSHLVAEADHFGQQRTPASRWISATAPTGAKPAMAIVIPTVRDTALQRSRHDGFELFGDGRHGNGRQSGVSGQRSVLGVQFSPIAAAGSPRAQ